MPESSETPRGLWLLVPVKPFAEAKSRLASILTVQERSNLMRQLLGGVLEAAQVSELFSGIIVVSRDAEALALAAQAGATPLREREAALEGDPNRNLNQALEQGRAALPPEARALLVLPADLPEIRADELRRFIAAVRVPARDSGTDDPEGSGGVVALAPSVSGGTNALLLAPPNVIPFAFGVEAGRQSSDRHAALAVAAGARLMTIRMNALAFDVDLPEDYLILRAQGFVA